jgi:hypothetical protein
LEDRQLLSSFIVNNPTDTPVSGQTDLRQAIVEATSDTTNDTVTFDPTVFNTPQTITLNSGQLDLTKAAVTLTIQGPGANLLSVNSDNASRVFELNGGAATLSGLTATGGSATTYISYIKTTICGGGIQNIGGALALTNCTVSGNSATSYRGGLLNYSGTPALANTIVAGNTAGTEPDAAGVFTFTGYNLIGRTDCSSGWISTDLTGTGSSPLNPRLAALGNNGGPTQRMAFLPGSPAINAGNNALVVDASNNPLTYDQRGPGFPRIVGGTVDIGAFENQSLSVQQQITLIINQVNELALNGGNGLTAKLSSATNSFNAGKTTDGVNQLNAFINQVDGFKNAGKLTAMQAQSLIYEANQVITTAQRIGAKLLDDSGANARWPVPRLAPPSVRGRLSRSGEGIGTTKLGSFPGSVRSRRTSCRSPKCPSSPSSPAPARPDFKPSGQPIGRWTSSQHGQRSSCVRPACVVMGRSTRGADISGLEVCTSGRVSPGSGPKPCDDLLGSASTLS